MLRDCLKFIHIIVFTKKINLFAPNPKGCKLIFNTPGTCPDNGGRDGAMLKINIQYNIILEFQKPLMLINFLKFGQIYNKCLKQAGNSLTLSVFNLFYLTG